jgi:hypothetical protein
VTPSEELLKTANRCATALERIAKALEAGSSPTKAAAGKGNGTGKSVEVAADSDLDSQWGDPTINKDPPRWKGESYVGCSFSQTSPEYLDDLASFKDWSAAKSDEKGEVDKNNRPKSFYAKKDAARARGWAARLRNGWGAGANAQAARSAVEAVEDEGLPF